MTSLRPPPEFYPPMIKLSQEQKKELQRLGEERLRLLVEHHLQCELGTAVKRLQKDKNRRIWPKQVQEGISLKALISLTKATLKNDEMRDAMINEELLDFALGNEVLREMIEETKSEVGEWEEIHGRYSARRGRIIRRKTNSTSEARLMQEIERFIREIVAHAPSLEARIYEECHVARDRFAQAQEEATIEAENNKPN